MKVGGIGRGALGATSGVFDGATRPVCFLWNSAGHHVGYEGSFVAYRWVDWSHGSAVGPVGERRFRQVVGTVCQGRLMEGQSCVQRALVSQIVGSSFQWIFHGCPMSLFRQRPPRSGGLHTFSYAVSLPAITRCIQGDSPSQGEVSFCSPFMSITVCQRRMSALLLPRHPRHNGVRRATIQWTIAIRAPS